MITRRRLTAWLGCGLLAVLASGLLPAQAASAGEPQADGGTPKVELVLDVSGSMSARDIDGQSRMSAAKQAFDDVLNAVPSGVELGIRTLGANYPGNDRQVGCKDTAQLYPVTDHLDRTDAETAVATLQPTGWTPIGPALETAADDLSGGAGSRRIVLITDGEDTCQPLDPCQVARDIAAKGVDMTIDTLGLIPDAKTRSQLSCIAGATGGTYTTVQHRQELTSRVKQLVDRSTAPVVNPSPTLGGADCASAPTIKPGLYSDHETFSENRWYKVDVPPGRELRASVSVSADRPVNQDYGVLLRAVTAAGREIVRDQEDGSGRTDVVSAGLRYPKPAQDDDSDGNPPPPEPVCLQVGNSFSAPASVKTRPGLPVELSVDLVPSPRAASDVAFFGLGSGPWFLMFLTLAGFVAGTVWGWLSRWRVAIWRAN
jgi:Ca-activated chloride channel homolog